MPVYALDIHYNLWNLFSRSSFPIWSKFDLAPFRQWRVELTSMTWGQMYYHHQKLYLTLKWSFSWYNLSFEAVTWHTVSFLAIYFLQKQLFDNAQLLIQWCLPPTLWNNVHNTSNSANLSSISHKSACTIRMKSLTMFSEALLLLHHYKSNLAHLLAFQNSVIEF